ncbi:MAG: hypothetical protein WDA59_00515 [Methanofastidiosum sp.]
MEIAIVGLGIVGNALYKLLSGKGYKINRHDPEKGFRDNIDKAEIIFVCVNDKSEDMALVQEVIKDINKKNKKAIIIIRTTLIPGTTDALIKKYKRTIIYMPEFLRSWNAHADTMNPDKIVIGTSDREAFKRLINLFKVNIPIDKVFQVKPVEAEIAKLALNSLAVIKVVFAEEIYDLAKSLGADYEHIYKIFKADRNVNPRHLEAFKDVYRGAGGTCLPKDIGFLCHTIENHNLVLPLIHLARELNIHYLMSEEKFTNTGESKNDEN